MKKLNNYLDFFDKLLSINKSNYLGKTLSAVLVFISRFGMLPANMSPLGSFGFFGQNIFLYFLTIVAFDYFKGGFYSGFLFTYLGFFSYWMFGKFAKNQKLKVFFLPFASFSFFLISNFGVFWNSYPHTITGFLACYTLAIPFYKNTLIGDAFFGYGFLILKFLVKSFSVHRAEHSVVHRAEHSVVHRAEHKNLSKTLV